MATEFLLQLSDTSPFRELDGMAYAIWTYELSWSDTHSWGLLLSRQSQDLSGDVGIVFSRKLDIRNPSEFPEVADIQSTLVDRPEASQSDTLRVYRQFESPPDSPIIFAFIAPAARDTFCPVMVVFRDQSVAPWTEVPFATDTDSDPAQAQIITGPVFVCPSEAGGPPPSPPPGPPAPGPILSSETRRVPKATYVPLLVPEGTQDSGRALVKFGLLRRLALRPGELERAAKDVPELSQEDLNKLEAATSNRLPARPSVLTNVPVAALTALGESVLRLRQEALDRAIAATQHGTRPPSRELIEARTLRDLAAVALNGFIDNVTPTPVGMLNLERIEMTPVGVERGALLATIPLAPREKTAVVHKEWSVTTREFESIVTDSLENISETGVTENTELATATTSQTSHSNQFNVNGTVSGTYGPVSATVASSFTAQDQSSDSANESRKHAISMTRSASTRVKKEHKVTISTTTVTGTAESSTRVLTNPSETDPIRIDYFSLMRKWHVGLYRYGLRFTYDIAIPEPGAAMRELHAELFRLQGQVGGLFNFDVPHGDITADIRPGETEPHYLVLAERFDCQVPQVPAASGPVVASQVVPGLSGADNAIRTFTLPFTIKDDFRIKKVTLDAQVSSPAGIDINMDILGSTFHRHGGNFGVTQELFSRQGGGFLANASGNQEAIFIFQGADAAAVMLTIEIEPTPERMLQWQMEVWDALYNAALNQHNQLQQDIAARIAQIQDGLTRVDTLTLRREENEEVMKGVLRWLLGPTFEFMPDVVSKVFEAQHADPLHAQAVDLPHGIDFTGSQMFGDPSATGTTDWSTVFKFEEMVKFINQAIEWENVLYFLYPYFWDEPQSWDFLRQIEHPDSLRQAFLRAGSARVVLTVRPGWQDAWIAFVETGGFGTTLLPDHPYTTIAKEIEEYDRTNYPGIPPANPGGPAVPDPGTSVATQSSAKAAASQANVSLSVKSSDGFLAGYTAIIDSYDSGVQENQTIISVPDRTHIVVERLLNAHDGTLKPFAVMQGGEKGLLIAEWFEYTPTSGTDIAVTSNLATIS
jgi:hypothetical protein